MVYSYIITLHRKENKLKAVEKMANYKQERNMLLVKLETETLETLTVRGRGVTLEQYCIWAGLSEYGTSKQKAERLLKWKDQVKKTQVNANPKTIDELLHEINRVIETWEENANHSDKTMYSETYTKQMRYQAQGMKTAKYLVEQLKNNM
jgi:hypothetical protein